LQIFAISIARQPFSQLVVGDPKEERGKQAGLKPIMGERPRLPDQRMDDVIVVADTDRAVAGDSLRLFGESLQAPGGQAAQDLQLFAESVLDPPPV
jgi:hypothetical protein